MTEGHVETQTLWVNKWVGKLKQKSEAPRPQGGASRKGSFVHIVPLNPVYPALAGRGTFRPKRGSVPISSQKKQPVFFFQGHSILRKLSRGYTNTADTVIAKSWETSWMSLKKSLAGKRNRLEKSDQLRG
jgi:hypothetical protein